MLRRAIKISAVLSLAMALIAPSTLAATSSSTAQANGLKISPVRTELSIVPGQSKTVPIYITNPTNSPIQLQVFINDFTAKGDNGSPQLILNTPSNYPHGLSNFIAPIKNVSLLPYQTATVNVLITIPKDTSGGGYYAAVRFAPVSSTSSQSLTVTANIASLILVSVPGPGLNEQLNIASFQVEGNKGGSSRLFFNRNGLNAVVKFTNSGNVQEQPFGKIVVQSGSNTILTQAINNSASPGSVLPDSSRYFSVPVSHLNWFGEYKVSGYFGYGNPSHSLSASVTIYVIEGWFIAAVVAALVLIGVIIWLIVHRKLHKYHNAQTATPTNNDGTTLRP